jgi:hypothetical protein
MAAICSQMITDRQEERIYAPLLLPGRCRYLSVTTAPHRPTVTHPDTWRDKKETARRVAFPQPRGPFPLMVAGVGFEPT